MTLINRLRAQFTGIFPALERVLDLTNTGSIILLTGYRTPAALRRIGVPIEHTFFGSWACPG
jgi:hypothetical protein